MSVTINLVFVVFGAIEVVIIGAGIYAYNLQHGAGK